MIKVICIGKLKEKYLVDACQEYIKRIKGFYPFDIIELKDSTMQKEKEEILKNISPKDYIITLEIEGKEMTSLDFAAKLDTLFLDNANITFIIGGSDGLHPEVKKQSHFSLSFSKLTFPHQLFRVMLLEQIYRACKINHHQVYHK